VVFRQYDTQPDEIGALPGKGKGPRRELEIPGGPFEKRASQNLRRLSFQLSTGGFKPEIFSPRKQKLDKPSRFVK
jgi:hypothetical protein